MRKLYLTLILVCACDSEVELESEAPREDAVSAAVPTGAVDTRAPVRAIEPPPPISGGTLAATKGGVVVVADEARGTIHGVDAASEVVSWTLELGASARPGRVVESDEGVHVVLRGIGELLSLGFTGEELGRASLCVEPTGLAFSPARQQLLVACRDGALLAVEPSSSEVTPLGRVGTDPRDLLVVRDAQAPTGERVFVTRFRSALLCELDETWAPFNCVWPKGSSVQLPAVQGVNGGPSSQTTERAEMAPAVAWRALGTDDGAVLLHQRGRTGEIDLGQPTSYGSGVESGLCSAVAGPAVTLVQPDGAIHSSLQLPAGLFVDIAISASGAVALANAGPQDETDLLFGQSPPPTSVVRLYSSLDDVLADTSDVQQAGCRSAVREVQTTTQEQAVSVAFDPADASRLFVQLLEPARLLIVDVATMRERYVDLSPSSVADTGHQLFHRITPSGLACAMCHPVGREDGRVWRFSSLGLRRTQSLEGGLRETAPFHWNGEFTNVEDLVGGIMVGRMGGVSQSDARVSAFTTWLFSLKAPPAVRPADDELALQGKVLFESSEVGCSSCHGLVSVGSENVDVGTGEALQVPLLNGIAHRAPYLHDGCASTLKERFGTCGGGDRHGKTSHLGESDIDALVAYLETL